MTVTYAMPISDLEQLVDKFIDDDDYMPDRATFISLLSANYRLAVKPFSPNAPDNLAPLKFKATKQGFTYKEDMTSKCAPIPYQDKLVLEKWVRRGCRVIKELPSGSLFPILSKLYDTPEWQQSKYTGNWLSVKEHANAYLEFFQ